MICVFRYFYCKDVQKELDVLRNSYIIIPEEIRIPKLKFVNINLHISGRML